MVLSNYTQGQDTTLSAPLEFMEHIPTSSYTTLSVDRTGNVYFLGLNRNLLRLGPNGTPLGTYSPPARGRISSIEAWNPMKVLLFYQDRQELLLLDRFLRPIASTSLPELNYNGTAKVATFASDDGYWLFDETNLTLSKLDLRLRKTTIETPLNLILDRERFNVRQLREYQNMVYLLDANAVYVFDNLGNYKKKLPVMGAAYIGFQGDELYYVKGGQLQFIHLYTSQKRAITLPADKAYETALLTENYLYLFTPKQAAIFKFN